MCVCVRVCVYGRVYVVMHARARACVCACVCTYVYVCVCIEICIPIQRESTFMCIFSRMPKIIGACVFVQTSIFSIMPKSIWACMFVQMFSARVGWYITADAHHAPVRRGNVRGTKTSAAKKMYGRGILETRRPRNNAHI